MFDRLAFFGYASYSFGWSKEQESPLSPADPIIIVRGKLSLFKGGLGATYFINKKVGVEGILFYQEQDYNFDSYSQIEKIYSINFNLGLQVYLNKN